MKSGRLWLVEVALAIVGLARSGRAREWTENSIINGCRLEPNISAAVTIECDYDGISHDSIAFQAGSIPTSTQIIRISNAKKINIREDALSSLPSLRTIHLSRTNSLLISKANWAQNARPEQATITVDSISFVRLGGGAFSGWPNPGPKIIIKNVRACDIQESAFDEDSAMQSVTLQNITALRLDDGAFGASIGQLHLSDVALYGTCRNSSFGGRIGSFTLSSVRIREVHGGCLQAGDGWDSLIIRSCVFEDIHPLGMDGNVNEVVIEDSSIRRISQRGLSLKTSTFTMTSTEVGEIAQDALDVRFSQSASLQTSKIGCLQADAFRRLISRAEEAAALTFREVSLNETGNGSLAFSEHTSVPVLDVVLRDACECNVDQRALQLVIGNKPSSSATDKQRRVARQIVEQVRCMAGTTTPTLAEFYCQHCPVTHRGNDLSRCSPTASLAAMPVWGWFLCGGLSVALLLLLAAGVKKTLAKRSRRSRQKEEQPPVESRFSDYRGERTAQAYHHTSVPVNLKPDKQQIAMVGAVPPTSNIYDRPKPHPEPVYAEVAVVLQYPGDRSPEYVNMTPLWGASPQQTAYGNYDEEGREEPLLGDRDVATVTGKGQPLYANTAFKSDL